MNHFKLYVGYLLIKKISNLNRLNRARNISPSAQFNIRAILSRVYIQLDARLIEKNYKKKIVYS